MATRAAANSFFLCFFLDKKKKKSKSKIEKKNPSWRISHPAAGQETNFFLRVALLEFLDTDTRNNNL